MAFHQYDVVSNLGARFKEAVVKTTGAAIGGSSVRVTVDDTAASSKEDVVKILEAIKVFITEKNWPPA